MFWCLRLVAEICSIDPTHKVSLLAEKHIVFWHVFFFLEDKCTRVQCNAIQLTISIFWLHCVVSKCMTCSLSALLSIYTSISTSPHTNTAPLPLSSSIRPSLHSLLHCCLKHSVCPQNEFALNWQLIKPS